MLISRWSHRPNSPKFPYLTYRDKRRRSSPIVTSDALAPLVARWQPGLLNASMNRIEHGGKFSQFIQ
ncbi:hypothetical protein Agabi119p4_3867 [Agaricus bisporus var. burnettii]|uniref:Uncharacterized protein n=1 Tax=Agaricus bisporus var. burnettii TaxID=192524 RepID=A0A8H7F5R0_AGABI|nr:hypothetical protein Agabi119p4_3867 [Agaricus bisporus var. burnettii]